MNYFPERIFTKEKKIYLNWGDIILALDSIAPISFTRMAKNYEVIRESSLKNFIYSLLFSRTNIIILPDLKKKPAGITSVFQSIL